MIDLIKQLLELFIGGFLQIWTGIFGGIAQMFNFGDYFNVIKNLSDGNAGYWIVGILIILVVLAVLISVVWLIVRAIVRLSKRIRSKNAVLDQDLIDEIAELQRQLVKTNMEKDRILGMKMTTGVGGNATLAIEGEGLRKHSKKAKAVSINLPRSTSPTHSASFPSVNTIMILR